MMHGLQRRRPATIEPGLQCPLCGVASTEAPYVYHQEAGVTAVYACQKCDFMFGRPVFIPELSQRQMDSIADAELYGSSLLKSLHRVLNLKREVERVRSLLGPGAHSLLDIGCGTGWTTRFWKEQGFDVTGLEPSAARRKIAQERYDIPVIGTYLEDAIVEEKFDLVILRHLIEHFADPRELVQKAAGFVAPGGVMLIIVPNINCLGRYLFDTNWTWVLPWHCNFFSPRSVKRLVESVGLRLAMSWQAPSPMYYHESFLRRLPHKLARKFFGLLGPAGMLLFTPLALVALVFGVGDNLSALAINDVGTNRN